MTTLEEAIAASPLIAILRGLEPSASLPVADLLFNAGYRIIEVPLNSPRPLESITRIAKQHGDKAIVGAGTVLSVGDVHAVAEAGGRIIISPNMNPAVGKAALERGMAWCPGVFTPSEAFAALEIGASILKFFPAEALPPKAIGAMRAVLPADAIVAVVGGITPEAISPYRAAGANAFGLGSALFRPGAPIDDVRQAADRFIAAWRSLES